MQKTALGTLTLASTLLSCALAAQDDAWALALDVAYNGKYVWRGINLVDDPVIQPSVSLSHASGLDASVWGNLETTDYSDHSGDFTEVDYTIDYSWSWESLALSAGAIYYDFPNTEADPTTEIYAAVGLDLFLSPTLTVYRDVDQVEGTYVSLGVGHTFENVATPTEGTSASLALSASLGHGSSAHNAAYYGHDGAALTDALFSASLPVAIGDSWTVSPAASYSTLLDGDIRDAMDDDDNLWAGITLSCSF